ncbi:MAG: hypothetical protein C0514_00385 [Candidatus Puniceispirillum sp.]|nr:hypothetical protein [Candidatus Puniceispirillum sp.]
MILVFRMRIFLFGCLLFSPVSGYASDGDALWWHSLNAVYGAPSSPMQEQYILTPDDFPDLDVQVVRENAVSPIHERVPMADLFEGSLIEADLRFFHMQGDGERADTDSGCAQAPSVLPQVRPWALPEGCESVTNMIMAVAPMGSSFVPQRTKKRARPLAPRSPLPYPHLRSALPQLFDKVVPATLRGDPMPLLEGAGQSADPAQVVQSASADLGSDMTGHPVEEGSVLRNAVAQIFGSQNSSVPRSIDPSFLVWQD